MANKAYLQHASSDELVFASIRLTELQYLAIVRYFGQSPDDAVPLPGYTEIVKRGRGWYRILPTTTSGAVNAVKSMMHMLLDLTTPPKPVATNSISPVGTLHLPRKVASASRLAELAQMFSKGGKGSGVRIGGAR